VPKCMSNFDNCLFVVIILQCGVLMFLIRVCVLLNGALLQNFAWAAAVYDEQIFGEESAALLLVDCTTIRPVSTGKKRHGRSERAYKLMGVHYGAMDCTSRAGVSHTPRLVSSAEEEGPSSDSLHPSTNFEAIEDYGCRFTDSDQLVGLLGVVDLFALSYSIIEVLDNVLPVGSDVRKYVFNVMGLVCSKKVSDTQKFNMMVAAILPFFPASIRSDGLALEGGFVRYTNQKGGLERERVPDLFDHHLRPPLEKIIDNGKVAYMSLLIGAIYARKCIRNKKALFCKAFLCMLEKMYSPPKVLKRMPLKEGGVTLAHLIQARKEIHGGKLKCLAGCAPLDESFEQYASFVEEPSSGSHDFDLALQCWESSISPFDVRGKEAVDFVKWQRRWANPLNLIKGQSCGQY